MEVHRGTGSLGRTELIRAEAIKENSHSWPVRKSLSQQFDLLPCQFQLSKEHARNVTARARNARHIPPRDRIIVDGNEDDWNAAACTNERLQRHFGPKRNHQIRLRPHKFNRRHEGSACIVHRLIFSDEILTLTEAKLT